MCRASTSGTSQRFPGWDDQSLGAAELSSIDREHSYVLRRTVGARAHWTPRPLTSYATLFQTETFVQSDIAVAMDGKSSADLAKAAYRGGSRRRGRTTDKQ